MITVGISQSGYATVINFDDQGLSGPSVFASAGPAVSIPINTVDGLVTFNGGVILTQTVSLPANSTSLYGTADFAGPTYLNPLTIVFANPVTNFFLDVYNGNTVAVDYTVSDNAGNSSSFTLDPNLSGGKTQIGFAATGDIISIFATPATNAGAVFDFFIDNINFNVPLPPDLQTTPVPGALPLMGSVLGIGGLIGWHRRRRHRPVAGA